MRRLKIYVLTIILWFAGFYNLERLIAPINLASFVYVLAAVYAVFVILYTPLYRLSAAWLFLASLVPYLGLKVALQYPIAGMNLPLTVTEVVPLLITIYLARQIGQGVEEFRSEILRLTVGAASVAAHPFQTAQAEFYREIRRARHYKRPAVVLSVAPAKESIDLSINRFLLEAQNSIIRQYIVARTADLLRNDLKETDIVTMRQDHFLVLLPETEQKHLDGIVSRLQSSAGQRLGFHLNIGAATFPEEAVTFESLVEQAEQRMKETTAVNRAPDNSAVPVMDETVPELQPRS
jgi:hypothetical protein